MVQMIRVIPAALVIPAVQAIPVVTPGVQAIRVVTPGVQAIPVVTPEALAIPVVAPAIQATQVVTQARQTATVTVSRMSSTSTPTTRQTLRIPMVTAFMTSSTQTLLMHQTRKPFALRSKMLTRLGCRKVYQRLTRRLGLINQIGVFKLLALSKRWVISYLRLRRLPRM